MSEKKITEKKKSGLWMKHAKKILEKVNALKGSYTTLSDEALKAKTDEFRNRIAHGESEDALLPEAFAAVREAAKRAIGLFPYDVQIIGGIALHEGKIAELKTGEGKTLVATLPAYLHALSGKGVHVVTVNDYLAQRDSETMGKIYTFMGLSVGTVLSSTPHLEKKENYECDITYVTNSELGFDYLRDNMAKRSSETVLRGLEYAIIDEVDSILIDEARTPLIISGEGKDVSSIFRQADAVAKSMTMGSESKEFNKIDAMLDDAPVETGDFIVHEKDKIVTLTADGVKKVEKAFGLKRYSDPANISIQHTVDLALKANYLMKKDKDYIVRDGEILLVDEFTGRIMEGRQYADGLQQAIEAKEGVEIREETQTIATTTYQSFFNKYARICGMTGTAYTEKKEFKSTYGLKVVVIPTNRPMIRVDMEDRIFMSKKAKFDAVIDDVVKTHATGQPILLGTASVKTSEAVSRLLDEADIEHTVLNAKQDAHEAEIIAKAGEFGAVTVATNMAGRGTDIILQPESVKAGGLKVIGTEKHESQRIDNQLRGRSGRQGDPGESVFYLSLEDDMMRLYGSDRTKKILENGGFEDHERITSRFVIRAIHKAQAKVEENNFGIRKNVFDYDLVNDKQRELIYQERRRLLAGDAVTSEVEQCFEHSIENIIRKNMKGKKKNYEGLIEDFRKIFDYDIEMEKVKGKSAKEVKKVLCDALEACKADMVFADEEEKESYERTCLFSALDTMWMEQLRALEFLRQSVRYLGYAQIDPKSEYAIEAFDLYSTMKQNIYSVTSSLYFNNRKMRRSHMEIITGHNMSDGIVSLRVRRDGADK